MQRSDVKTACAQLGLEVVRFGYHEVRGGRGELRRAVVDAFARSAAKQGFRKLG